MSLHDVQIAGDWASFESMMSYAHANIAKKRAVLERKMVPLEKARYRMTKIITEITLDLKSRGSVAASNKFDSCSH